MSGWIVVLAAVTAGAALSIVWLRATRAVVTVSGSSMQPTYRTGDRVLVRRCRGRRLRRGEVIVVAAPPYDDRRRPGWMPRRMGKERWLIKRVAALAGEAGSPAGVAGEVPAGNVAVLGDNVIASADSRTFGCLPTNRVLGVVVKRI